MQKTQGLLSLIAGGRIVPAFRHSQPVLRQPQQGGARLLVLRRVCGVETRSGTTPIFVAPTRHSEGPINATNSPHAQKMAPRGAPGGATEGLAMRRGFPPPHNSPTSICEMGSCTPTDFGQFESSARLREACTRLAERLKQAGGSRFRSLRQATLAGTASLWRLSHRASDTNATHGHLEADKWTNRAGRP